MDYQMDYQSMVKDLNESLIDIRYRVKCCSWDATIKINSVQEGINSLIWAVKNQKTKKKHEHAFPYNNSFQRNEHGHPSGMIYNNSFIKITAQYPIKLDVSSLNISEKVELIQRVDEIFHISDIMEAKPNSEPTNRLGNAPLLILTLEDKK